jgi:2-polyprenyl-3-methyl-5-hydroxy-6-metoxy-1,4-benzoquinol methylase
MTDLRKRSYQKELLDKDDIPFADIRQNMKELNTVNSLLGGHLITISGIRKLVKYHNKDNALTICEIGCGGGDNLKAISNYCEKKYIPAAFIGVDIKPECIGFAKEQYPRLDAKWIISDYRLVNFGVSKPGIIFSSLFCHHFTEDELVSMLIWMRENSKTGFFINDLHRHSLAYYSIKLMTKLFSRSYLVKNDAPLSVARGFTKKEWQAIFERAGIKNYSIAWRWAFRYLIISNNGGE